MVELRCALLPILLTAIVTATRADDPNLPAFSPQDQLAAVRALCGQVSRGSATSRMGPTPETVNGFLSADKSTLYVELLSVSYDEGGTIKHAIVFGGHQLDAGEIDHGEAMQTEISAAVLEYRGGKWALVTRGAALTEASINGMDPQVELKKSGAKRHALVLTESAWNRGSGQQIVSLYEAAGAEFVERFISAVSADDCGWNTRCFRFEGTLAYDEQPGADAFDVRLTLKGTYRNANGRIATVPAQPLVFRLKGAEYAPAFSTPALRAVWEAVQHPWDR